MTHQLTPSAAPRYMWQRMLIIAAVIFLAWTGCFAIGVGAATLGGSVYGCHITEGGDGGCPTLAGFAGLALIGAFGAPIFVIGIAVCLLGSIIAFIFRRK
jgi:hypothetical protein